ncbi:MAG TPA: hypothetical protein VNQ76_19405, partial [Planctomicrobium sp.]|nr:hypothetical protein [Planctomicrobium sp.]
QTLLENLNLRQFVQNPVQLGNALTKKLCLAIQRPVSVFLDLNWRRLVSEVDFDMNHEAELLGECVPKPELGNEERPPNGIASLYFASPSNL